MDHIAADADSYKSVLYHRYTHAHDRVSAFASSFLRENVIHADSASVVVTDFTESRGTTERASTRL